MKINKKIEDYIFTKVNKAIKENEPKPYSNGTSIHFSLTDGKTFDMVKELIKEKYNVSDEIIENSSIGINVYADYKYKSPDPYYISNKIIADFCIQKRKIKEISELDALIEEHLKELFTN